MKVQILVNFITECTWIDEEVSQEKVEGQVSQENAKGEVNQKKSRKNV